MDAKTNTDEVLDAYQEMVKDKSAYLFCDNCGAYPLEPVHGHFICKSCFMPTKCCEGAPA